MKVEVRRTANIISVCEVIVGEVKTMRTYKRSDCIKFCIARIHKLWKLYGYDAKHAERNKAYNECKEFCKNNGYSGVNFNDIWKRSLNIAKNTI